MSRLASLVVAPLVLATAIIGNLSFAAESAEPTLQETADFIQRRLDACEGSYASGYELTAWSTSFDLAPSGKATFESLYFDSDHKEVTRFGMLLGDLTPEITVTYVYKEGPKTSANLIFVRFTLHCRKDRCIRGTILDIEGAVAKFVKPGTAFRVNSQPIFVCKRYAARILKALAHAIRLSGGKDEPF
ncbi:MAG: hypothetical protein OXU75_22220 [Deltaproteobacteria bacterium]|nr:hypothetical protein [Deltaproteobacteria bacterium]